MVPAVVRVRHKMVSLENPLEPGACTSKTSGLASAPSLVRNQVDKTEATCSGSRCAISGMGREFTQTPGGPGGPLTSATMQVVVELPGGRTELTGPDDFSGFSVAVLGEGTQKDLATAVAASGLGRMGIDGAHVVVLPAALRRLARDGVDAAWEAGFEAMCAYARTKGWIEDDGAILAHVEWRLSAP